MTHWLIVNADDYGHTPGVSAGIREAHLRGIVTSTSVMMNRPDAENGLKTAAEVCPGLGMGVHLVLTSGTPVLPPGRIPGLVQPNGSFYKLDGFLERFNTLDLEEIRAEWNAQVEKFIRVAGRTPDHLDSHHHSSYFTPALLEMMLKLAEQLHCPIRKPFGPGSAEASDYLPSELSRQNTSQFRRVLSSHPVVTADRFIGSFYDETATTQSLVKILEEIALDEKFRTFELMCHPAHVDDALRECSDYNKQRDRERLLLQDPLIRQKINDHHIQLITYPQLVNINAGG